MKWSNQKETTKKQQKNNSIKQENVTDLWIIKKKFTVHMWKNEDVL